MRGPDIIGRTAFVNLSEKELLVPLRVKHDIERASGRAFKSSVEAGPGLQALSPGALKLSESSKAER